MDVKDEYVHDSKILPDLVDEVLKTNGDLVGQLLADGAYDLMILLDTYQRIGVSVHLRKSYSLKMIYFLCD